MRIEEKYTDKMKCLIYRRVDCNYWTESTTRKNISKNFIFTMKFIFINFYSNSSILFTQESKDRHFSLFSAIHKMASPDVSVDLDTIVTNIIMVNLNNSKINSADFYNMLLKVIFVMYVLRLYVNVTCYTFVQVENDDDIKLSKIKSTSVRISYLYEGCVRLVLHKNISKEDVDTAIEKIKYVIGKISSSN